MTFLTHAQTQAKLRELQSAEDVKFKSGYCETCGQWDSQLEDAQCKPCADRYLNGTTPRADNTVGRISA